MKISYRDATEKDIDLLIELYNNAFYSDYVRYGECPAYGRNYDRMKKSQENYPKTIINVENKPVGVISLQNKGNGEYYLGCLGIIPPYQRKGIGSAAIQYILDTHKDCKRIRLHTPSDKVENIMFYTKKCGFKEVGTKQDGNVKVSCLVLE